MIDRGFKQSFTVILVMAVFSFLLVFIDSATKIKAEKEPDIKPVENVVIDNNDTATSTQYVLLSFDGSKDNSMWRKTLDFARDFNKDGDFIHFTYFINGVYFLLPENSGKYNPPNAPSGKSMIGFAEGVRDIENRVANINRAIEDGHEIGSHAAGHFAGSAWSFNDWKQEFNEQNKLLNSISINNPEIPTSTIINFKNTNLLGFRAPELSTNSDMYEVLKDFGFKYDSSITGNRDTVPYKDQNGIWIIPLVTIPVGDKGGKTLSMDYNFRQVQTNGYDLAVEGTEYWETLKKETTDAFKGYFNYEYNGPRNPVTIGNHFTLMNDGVYWESMKQFISDVCKKKDVKCVTMSEYVKHLDKFNK